MSQSLRASFLYYLQVFIGVSVVLYLGRIILIPLAFGVLIALVLYPTCRWLERKGLSSSLSIAVNLCFLLLLTSILIGLLSWQLVAFEDDFPLIIQKLQASLKEFQEWLNSRFSITLDMQTQWLRKTLMNLSEQAGSLLSGTLVTTVNLLFFLIMVPLFTVLILYYRRLLLKALMTLIPSPHQQSLTTILSQTIQIYHNYVKGLLWVYLIVGLLNSLGLALLGIRQPILFGMAASILTIIPYVGIIVGSLLPISVAWLMYDTVWYPLGVIAVFTIVQYLEANVIFPLVVGSQLKINALAAMVALFVGGVIWGVSGMVLFLPFAAILKIISDHVPAWKPLCILLSPMEEQKIKHPSSSWLVTLVKRFRSGRT